VVGGDSPGDGDAGDNQQHFAAFGGVAGTGGNCKWEHQNPATSHVSRCGWSLSAVGGGVPS